MCELCASSSVIGADVLCSRVISDSEPVSTGPSEIPLEGSIIPVVEGMFQDGLVHREMAPGVDAALLATTAAWAVFGAARRWEMAAKIEAIVRPVLLNGSQ